MGATKHGTASRRPRAIRRRLTAGGLLAALAVFGMGGLAANGVAAPRPVAHAFTGRTSQHAGRYGPELLPSDRISFSVQAGALHDLVIPWVASCTAWNGAPASVLMDQTVIPDALRLHNGRFSATAQYTFAPGPAQSASVEQFDLAGRVRGGRVTGTLYVTGSVQTRSGIPVAQCETPPAIHFSGERIGRSSPPSAPALTRPAQATPGSLVYTRRDPRSGASAIWGSDSDGRGQAQLTAPPAGAADSQPLLVESDYSSPTLIFVRTSAEVSQILVSLLTRSTGRIISFRRGSAPPQLVASSPQGVRDPAYSAGRLAFTVGSGADCTVWLKDARGERRLTDHGGGAGCDDMPAFSPSGGQVAFRRTVTDAAGVARSTSYLVVATGGGTPRRLAVPPSTVALSWAPGGRIVLLEVASPSTAPVLQTVRADGSELRTITRGHDLTGRPVWSDSGDRILAERVTGPTSSEIVALPPLGGPLQTIIADPGHLDEQPFAGPSPVLPTVGGGEPGPGVHARSRSAGRRSRR